MISGNAGLGDAKQKPEQIAGSRLQNTGKQQFKKSRSCEDISVTSGASTKASAQRRSPVLATAANQKSHRKIPKPSANKVGTEQATAGHEVTDAHKMAVMKLYTALKTGDSVELERLLQAECDGNTELKVGRLVFHLIIELRTYCVFTVCLMFLQAAIVNTPVTRNGETLLHLAASLSNVDIISLLLLSGADPTIKATTQGSAKVGKVVYQCASSKAARAVFIAFRKEFPDK